MPRRPQGLRLNVRNVGRNNRLGGYGRALAQGTAMAFRNRAAIVSGTRTATQAARSILSRSTGYLRKKFTGRKVYNPDRSNQGVGHGSELSKANITIGNSSRSASVKKLVNASRQAQILRFSAVSPFMNTATIPLNAQKTEVGAGAFWLHNFYDGTSQITLPCHIYDLTSMPNVVNGSVTAASPAFYMKQVATTGAISWAPMSGNKNDITGVTSAWQYEDTATIGTFAGTQPLRQTIMDYVQARMMCYGSAKMATQYVIEIIQLKDDWICPDIMGGTLPSSAGLNYKNSANQFWNSYVKSYCAHPVATTNPQAHKNYKVIKTIRFIIPPRLSNETDAAVGNCKQLNIFFKTNRTCKFDWAEDTIDPNVESGAAFPTEQGQLQLTVHPKARLYMTVRATSVTQLNNTVPSVDYTPSYDIICRKKYTTLQ